VLSTGRVALRNVPSSNSSIPGCSYSLGVVSGNLTSIHTLPLLVSILPAFATRIGCLAKALRTLYTNSPRILSILGRSVASFLNCCHSGSDPFQNLFGCSLEKPVGMNSIGSYSSSSSSSSSSASRPTVVHPPSLTSSTSTLMLIYLEIP